VREQASVTSRRLAPRIRRSDHHTLVEEFGVATSGGFWVAAGDPIDDDDTEEANRFEERTWFIQCKRERHIGPARLQKVVEESRHSPVARHTALVSWRPVISPSKLVTAFAQ